MRVALVTNNYLPFCGGVTTSVETLRRGLEIRGHEAWVLAPRFRTETADGPRVIRYPSIPAATYPEFALAVPFAPRITRRVRRLEVDVFHSHHPFLLGPAARRLARQQRRPLVFTYHTRYDKYAHYVPFRRSVVEGLAVRLSTRFAAGADAVIAPSCVIRDELITRGVRTPIAVVPTGVDLARFQPGDVGAARRQLGLDPRDMIVLYVGRLDREKSVDLILLAFERVAGTVSRARLVLVGDGTQREELRRRAARSAVSERVTFLGVRPHDTLPTCYQAADLFVFASETETQGLVLADPRRDRGSGPDHHRRPRLQRGRPRRRDGRPHQGRSRRPGRGGDRSPRRRRAPPRDGRAGARGGRERVRRAAPDRPHAGGLRTSALAPRGTPAVSADGTPDGAPPRRILVRLRDEWAGERGLFASDPRVRTLRRVLVSYPEVRHILPDIISLEGVVDARVVDTMTQFLQRQQWLVKSVDFE